MLSTLPRLSLLLLLPALGACAGPGAARPDTAPARASARETVTTGQPYALRQQGALQPPGADGDEGGRIRGKICGADVGLQVEHQSGAIVIEGRIADVETEIWVGREAGGRIISGTLGDESFDLHLGQQRLYGRIGMVLLDLSPAGRLTVGEADDGTKLDLGSWGQLWSMPAATQGALVPLLLACAHARDQEGLAFLKAPSGT